MLPLFFCIFEILLQMAGIVTICKSHCAVRSDAIPPDWSILLSRNDKKPFCMASRSAIQKGFLLIIQLSTAGLV